ncbi:MAG: Pup--protein ligase [Actinomycetota bacterium]|jgi:proteasome accessory factor A
MASQFRRIYGIETEFGVTCTFEGQRRLTPDEVARYLFKRVVAWGRSSNVFLTNGSRLYLDVGSHPEYATAECDDLEQLVIHDRAGERVVEDLISDAQDRLAEEGIDGEIYLFKNNTDSSGNSYGCHENYLIRRRADYLTQIEALLPFLISRQLISGAGKVLETPRGTIYSLSQRADHMWEGVSSATTRSRPIINTRDEPHADSESYRRLHVIVGDSNMSEMTTMLKVASMEFVLRMLEANYLKRDFTLDNPIRAIRDVSHDITGRGLITLASGQSLTALEMQGEYLRLAKEFSADHDLTTLERQALELWERTLVAIETSNYKLIDRDIDWAIKKNLLDGYMQKHGLELDNPRIAQLDLMYHDITQSRGLFYLLERKGMANRISTDEKVLEAKTVPPQTTRAKLRGDFISAAQSKNKDISVDWVHLKMNDQTQRTVLCKDPFANTDERVQRLIDAM